ncbi:MAG TPA: NAD(P)-dependent oxidoreductase [Planctomycetes bacterium]|nr:NAD(P)-dependent oxidoreductase [Planctomycetota bacterium]
MSVQLLDNKRIMLIGGAGFIGHNLALHLKSLGADVSVVDSLSVNNIMAFSSYNEEIVNRELCLEILQERQILLRNAKVPLYVQDARDYHALGRLFNLIEPQVVVQLSAVSHAAKSNKDPYSTFDHSMRTLENALDVSRDNIEHFIFFSSSMVYGHFEESVVTEEALCEPIGIYGALKYGGEKLVIAYNQVFNLPYTIIRPSALYGERCVSRRIGQIFIENALTGKAITLNGDGFDRLDFTYIGDLVRGIQNVIENDNAKNQIFNLTYGEGRSLADMANIMLTQFPDLEIKYQPKDKLTPDRGTLSVDKAKQLIGYKPQFPLDKGYLDYINWYKEFYVRKNAS